MKIPKQWQVDTSSKLYKTPDTKFEEFFQEGKLGTYPWHMTYTISFECYLFFYASVYVKKCWITKNRLCGVSLNGCLLMFS
jgi:hypothetical protein